MAFSAADAQGEDAPCEDKPGTSVDNTYQHDQPVYFPEELVGNWLSFSRLGLYYSYKISLRGCFSAATTPTDIILAVRCDLGPEFLCNSFKMGGVQVTIEYAGIMHLNQEQVIYARRFQTTILSLLISKDHSEVSDAIKDFHELQVSMGVVYLLLPSVDGKVDCLLHLKDGSVNYTKYFKTRHGLHLTCKTQPLLAAGGLFTVQNCLHKGYKRGKEPGDRNGVELPPELCRVVMAPVSANTLRVFTFVPSIMYRIQCILLSVKLKIQLGPRMQQFNVKALKIVEALTTTECQEEFSQESLETLGDSFLKYATSQHLFSKYKHLREDMLTSKRKELVSNTALCNLACSRKLVGFIRGEEFKPKGWIIPGLGYDKCGNSKFSIRCSNDMYSLKKISIKSDRIADSVEALIAAYLSLGGEHVEALTHGSFKAVGTSACNQRLEFLGDAILDYILTVYFFKQYYPACTPELLTDLRKASVNNHCYAHASVKNGLHKHYLYSDEQMTKVINDLENSGRLFSGPSHGSEPGTGLPKYLADLIESIAGAIYLDSKCDKEKVWRATKRLLQPLATAETVERDPVTELKQLCEQKNYPAPSYSTTVKDGVTTVIAKVWVAGALHSCSGTRTGRNKDAMKSAAKALLKKLKAAGVP
ncbi:hypothetical protein QOZ80_3AG0227340 [Eleusine coracana subsp. coracana]|nr:hypothetical protein QOZ80_3AG0227340 [Eleusine coracana subsp. coracana]